ncbi:MAG: hypothetical protein QOI52_66, partial [Chloroflexota bacterium]|nr:hypothetical protein [Chloroflexota bacterium]
MAPSYAGRATLATMPTEQERVAATRAAYAGLQPRIAAGEPWPLATEYGTEPEASWGPREVLAHVAEMLPFWLGELERVVDGVAGGGTTPFGRSADDPIRIGSLVRDRTLPLRVLFARIDGGLRAWEDRLASLTDDERARPGRHPRLGELPAA